VSPASEMHELILFSDAVVGLVSNGMSASHPAST
jgi:hypothetical protein